VPALPSEQFRISWETWQTQVELTDTADAALIANDRTSAENALTTLRATYQDGLHPLPEIDALIGLGDAARQADRFEEAAARYEAAMELAAKGHYKFGLVRTLVSVGYLTLLSGSARQAAGTFRRAADLSRELDERTYLAVALTGLGDALVRLHEDDEAERVLAEAIQLCEFLRADVGIVNAAQQLGDLYRSRKRLDEAKAVLTRALEAAERSETLIGQVNACDGLGEVSLGLGDLDDARRYYLRAYELSVEHRYRRGEAWALFGLGRCGYALDLPHEAHQLFAGALEAHQELGDLPSSATALDGMARAAAAMGDAVAETHARVDAVLAIEAMRSSQDRHQYQQEYRERFAAVYSAAIRAASGTPTRPHSSPCSKTSPAGVWPASWRRFPRYQPSRMRRSPPMCWRQPATCQWTAAILRPAWPPPSAAPGSSGDSPCGWHARDSRAGDRRYRRRPLPLVLPRRRRAASKPDRHACRRAPGDACPGCGSSDRLVARRAGPADAERGTRNRRDRSAADHLAGAGRAASPGPA
jgi:tetratricopeptide (TPR) repeat protein